MLAIEYEPNIQENINQTGGDILTKDTALLKKLKEQTTFSQASTDIDSSNNSYFNATMLIIEKSPKIECISYDSLYGFIFKIEVPVEYQFFEYFDYAKIKIPLTHILLKIVICNDTPGKLEPLKIGENKPGVEGMVNVSIDLMSQIITGKSNNPNIKEYRKHSETIYKLITEVKYQQFILKNTINTNIPVCPSILDFFWIKCNPNENPASTTFLNLLKKESNESNSITTQIIDYLLNINSPNRIGCIAMEYAGQGEDNFITLHQFMNLQYNDYTQLTYKDIKPGTKLPQSDKENIKLLFLYRNILISIFTNILRMIKYGKYHMDLHSNNIFINNNALIDYYKTQNLYSNVNIRNKVVYINTKKIGRHNTTPFLTYILDFGKIDSTEQLTEPPTILTISTIFDEFKKKDIAKNNRLQSQTIFTLLEKVFPKPTGSNYNNDFLIEVLRYYNDFEKEQEKDLPTGLFDETKIDETKINEIHNYEATLSGGDQSIFDVSKLTTNATDVLSNVSVANSQKTVATQSIDLPNKANEILNNLISQSVATTSEVNQPIDLPNKANEILNNLISQSVATPSATTSEVNQPIDVPNTAIQILNSLIQPSVSSSVAAPIVNTSIDLPNQAIAILNNLISQSVATPSATISKVNQPIDLPNQAMQILNNLISQSVATPSATTSEVNKSIDLPNTAMQILNNLITPSVVAPIVNQSNIALGTGTEHIKISSYELDEQNLPINITNKFLTFDPGNNTFITTK